MGAIGAAIVGLEVGEAVEGWNVGGSVPRATGIGVVFSLGDAVGDGVRN